MFNFKKAEIAKLESESNFKVLFSKALKSERKLVTKEIHKAIKNGQDSVYIYLHHYEEYIIIPVFKELKLELTDAGYVVEDLELRRNYARFALYW